MKRAFELNLYLEIFIKLIADRTGIGNRKSKV